MRAVAKGAPKRRDVARREPQEKSLAERLGEVDLKDHVACAVLLDEIRTLETHLGSAKQMLTRAILERAGVDGLKSYDLPDRREAQIRVGTSTTISPEVLEEGLRKAGMPDERISEIVVQTVSKSVVAKEAKKAASMNPDYADALTKASSTHATSPSVTIRRR